VRSNIVPVGKDNASHVEVTREIARRFNGLYGEVFPIPELMIGDVPTLVGTDGQAKMSKSIGNTIFLSDDEATVRRRVFSMYTDPARIRADIPGTVEGNPVFVYHDTFNPDRAEVDDLKRRYREGTVADVEVKERLSEAINAFLAPMRERRAAYESDRGYVETLIVEGTARTRDEVVLTVREMRSAMGLASTWNRIRRRAEDRAKKIGAAGS
jgi:tryptophanyl-tRNA synthetase